MTEAVEFIIRALVGCALVFIGYTLGYNQGYYDGIKNLLDSVGEKEE